MGYADDVMHMFGHHRHGNDNPFRQAPDWGIELDAKLSLVLKNQEINAMATQAQLDKLKTDIAALIQAGVAEITAAVAAAQAASNDPAIDALDTQVTAATQSLTDAAAALKLPPAAPPTT